MIYDDASWHRGDGFPPDLPPDAAATHSGMFLAWSLLAGLGGEHHLVDSPDEFEHLRARKITPGAYLLTVCDGKFTPADLNSEGNAFARAYFQQEGATFFADYREYLAKGLPSDYHVADNWSNFDKLTPVLDRRLANWRRGRPADSPPDSGVTASAGLPEDIVRRIAREFGGDEAPRAASRLAGFASQYADKHRSAPEARVLRALVYLAAGDRQKLDDACRLALADSRDVFRDAEYDGDQRVRDFNLPFED